MRGDGGRNRGFFRCVRIVSKEGFFIHPAFDACGFRFEWIFDGFVGLETGAGCFCWIRTRLRLAIWSPWTARRSKHRDDLSATPRKAPCLLTTFWTCRQQGTCELQKPCGGRHNSALSYLQRSLQTVKLLRRYTACCGRQRRICTSQNCLLLRKYSLLVSGFINKAAGSFRRTQCMCSEP